MPIEKFPTPEEMPKKDDDLEKIDLKTPQEIPEVSDEPEIEHKNKEEISIPKGSEVDNTKERIKKGEESE